MAPFCLLLLLALLASCHDAQRENPFDPNLTPASQLQVALNDTLGTATLTWTPYSGKAAFASYRVLRKVAGVDSVDTLATITDPAETSFLTSLEPEISYSFRVLTENQSAFTVSSEEVTAREFSLPPVHLDAVSFSSDSASADLFWSAYGGPGFDAYEIHRSADGLSEGVVMELADVGTTAFVDTSLDGNTEYTYQVYVRSIWGEATGVGSNLQSGMFHGLQQVMVVPLPQNLQPYAIGLAVDELDDLFVGSSTISELSTSGFGVPTLTAAVWACLPDAECISLSTGSERPDLQSTVQMAAGGGQVYAAVGLDDGTSRIWALDHQGEVAWTTTIATARASPVGLDLVSSGDLVMFDSRGWRYQLRSDNEEVPQRRFIFGFPDVVDASVGPATVDRSMDRIFLSLPNSRANRLMSGNTTEDTPGLLFTVLDAIDRGVGHDRGMSQTTVALAFDPQRSRLLALEEQGRVLVFEAMTDFSRFVTQWGEFGSGDGQFKISSAVGGAIVVDSKGTIYIADDSGRIQVFES